MAGSPQRRSAGQRDRVITIEALTESVGPSGFPIETWAPLTPNVYAARDDQYGSETFVADQLSATADAQWTLPYRADCDPELVDVAKRRRVVTPTIPDVVVVPFVLALDELFAGAAGTLPTGWMVAPWLTGGTAACDGSGAVVVEGALLRGPEAYLPPTIESDLAGTATEAITLEWTGRLAGDAFQVLGWGVDLDTDPNWALFSTRDTPGAVWASSSSPAGGTVHTLLASLAIGETHRYRITWRRWTYIGGQYGRLEYAVDDAVAATHDHPIGVALYPIASDFTLGAGAVSADRVRVFTEVPPPPAPTGGGRIHDILHAEIIGRRRGLILHTRAKVG